MAMRYVQGGDIRSLLSQTGPLQPAMAWTILTQAASALDAAHARSLIHRDVKPANLLLEASHVYLADFGMGADTSRDRSITWRRSRSRGAPSTGAQTSIRWPASGSSCSAGRRSSGTISA